MAGRIGSAAIRAVVGQKKQIKAALTLVCICFFKITIFNIMKYF